MLRIHNYDKFSSVHFKFLKIPSTYFYIEVCFAVNKIDLWNV